MKRSAAVLTVVALFLLGALAGAFATRIYYQRVIHERHGMLGFGSHAISADLKRRLNLTADQQAKVDAIVGDAHREMMAFRPQLLAVLRRAHYRIAEILTPEQRAEFERYAKERHKHFLGGGHH
ncbi:MAG TPA: hypothetical protein VHQ90_22600 [Thermoanaerobaculia bacterium]|nr:hypothetical protein [Thermoanaerobaculia bacterium]